VQRFDLEASLFGVSIGFDILSSQGIEIRSELDADDATERKLGRE
jgi:hypothetical protein